MTQTTEEKFMEIFSGLDRAYGIYEITGQKNTAKGIKKDGRGKTLQEPLTLDLWKQHIAGEVSIGVIPLKDDETCKWGCIDIDEYPIDVKKIIKSVADMSLPVVPCSTKSGGVHLFLFTEEPVPAIKFRNKLEEIAAALGRTGDEIFPKQYQWSTQLPKERQTGNWLNMPYFSGEDTTRYGLNASGDALSLEEFIDFVKKKSISEKKLDELVPVKKSRRKLIAKDTDSIWNEAPPCLVHMKLNGVPEGCRNTALFSYGVFFRKAYPETEEWKDKLYEVNKQVCSKPISHSEMTALILSIEKSDYRYQCSQPPLVDFCQSGICVTKRFGIDASERDPVFGGLRKYLTDPPLWHLDMDGQTIVLETKQLHNFSMFQQRCMEVLNACPPDVKKIEWVARLNTLLQDVQEVDMPSDMTKSGLLEEGIMEFCVSTESISRLAIMSGGAFRFEEAAEKPQWWFRGRDVVKYIHEYKGMKTVREAEIFDELKKMGANNSAKWIDKSVGNKNIWVLDVIEIDNSHVTAEDFKKPVIDKEWE
tara:strand:- start:60 stop:1658 length:1599 start_codon:yes stop_codon:yes gene_type:complete